MRSQTMMFLFFAALAVAPAAQERMYKCVDAKGKTYYTRFRLRSASAATRRS